MALAHKNENKPTQIDVDPGSEAAEPSPGEEQGEPTAEDLKDVNQMYEEAAKKRSDEAAADPDSLSPDTPKE